MFVVFNIETLRDKCAEWCLQSKLHVESYWVMIPADELLQHCRTVPTSIALLVGHKLLKVHLSGILVVSSCCGSSRYYIFTSIRFYFENFNEIHKNDTDSWKSINIDYSQQIPLPIFIDFRYVWLINDRFYRIPPPPLPVLKAVTELFFGVIWIS